MSGWQRRVGEPKRLLANPGVARDQPSSRRLKRAYIDREMTSIALVSVKLKATGCRNGA